MNRTNINTALYSRLAGGTALTSLLGGTFIYFQNAPDNKALPYVVVSVTSDIEENLSANRTINMLVMVRAYASTPTQANNIDAQVDTLLHNNPLTISGASSNFWLARETSYQLSDMDQSSRRVYSSGAEYRIRVDI